MPPSRRRVLKTLSGGISIALLAGCSAVGGPGGTPDEPQRTPVDSGVIEPAADMVEPMTSDHPATVRLAIENVSDETLLVLPGERGGYALEWIDPLEPDGDQSGTIIFHPGHPKVVIDNPEELDAPVNGCWRFPSDAIRGFISETKYTSLLPGDSYAVDHDIYYRGPDGGCFPEGTYRTTVSVIPVARPTPADKSDMLEPRVAFEAVLTVSPSGDSSVGLSDS